VGAAGSAQGGTGSEGPGGLPVPPELADSAVELLRPSSNSLSELTNRLHDIAIAIPVAPEPEAIPRSGASPEGSAPEVPDGTAPYRRGPEKKAERTARRNALITQALDNGIVDEEKIYQFVCDQDPSLLWKNNETKKPITVKSMMAAYRQSKQS
jgi:hypothetical protein